MQTASQKMRLRIAGFLAAGPARLEASSADGKVLLQSGERGAISVDRATIAAMAREGTLVRREGEVALSPEGAALHRRGGTAGDGFQAQHRDLDVTTIDAGDEIRLAIVNRAESPLSQLVRLKGRNGKAFLDPGEFGAGERLRSDYTRGQIMPRLGANWEASVSSGARGNRGPADLTDAAMAARQRVDAAIAAVGPELSGVLIDVCCFLKGLELVERERGWPVRSAKIVLKTALAVLNRHYDPPPKRRTESRRPLHWGGENYRPDTL